MKPVIYINPEGSVHFIQDCPEEPSKPGPMDHQEFTREYYEDDLPAYYRALAEAKKNSIPFEDQEEGEHAIICSYPEGTSLDLVPNSLHPFPEDQYSVGIKEICASYSCHTGLNCIHCKEPTQVAVLSLKPQEDKLISETKDMKTDNELLIAFPDQSKSFTYGVEYGRILEKMERGEQIVMNNGFPIRMENKVLIEATCKALGYIPTFGAVHFDEWVEFMGIKKASNDN